MKRNAAYMTGRVSTIALRSVSLIFTVLAFGSALAQTPTFWDPHHHLEKPDLTGMQVLRFVTEDDYPPFDFLAPDGSLTGFNVDLARALCEALSISCTVQARRWDTIVNAIENGQADAAVASLAETSDARKSLDFTMPYYRSPARFVARKASAVPNLESKALAGRTIGVVAHSAHEAFLRAFFSGADIRTYETEASLLSALKRQEIELAFGDGISLAAWLNGRDSDACCRFVGGPYTESRYFGDGTGIAVRKGNSTLREALNWAIEEIGANGKYSELYLKWFPISFF